MRDEFQDCGVSAGHEIPVYHTHGLRQYYGTCRFHKRPDCTHLRNWKPGWRCGGKVQLKRVIMREWVKAYGDIPESMRCRTCYGEA